MTFHGNLRCDFKWPLWVPCPNFSVPVQTSDPQTSHGTNIRLKNVDHYKHRTKYKRRTSTHVGLVETSDRKKRQTSTNVRPVQTSDQYKRRTSTNVRPVQTSDYGKRFYLNFKIFLLKSYFLLSNGLINIYPKKLSSLN